MSNTLDEVRMWGVDEIDEQTRRELFTGVRQALDNPPERIAYRPLLLDYADVPKPAAAALILTGVTLPSSPHIEGPRYMVEFFAYETIGVAICHAAPVRPPATVYDETSGRMVCNWTME